MLLHCYRISRPDFFRTGRIPDAGVSSRGAYSGGDFPAGDALHPGAGASPRCFVAAWFALILLLLAGSARSGAQTITPQGQIPLFNGSSLSGLYPWFSTSGFSDPDQVFRVENGLLHVTGNGWGALTTNGRYRDYVMVLEFKWGSQTWGSRQGLARDAGLLFHSNGVEGGWDGLLMPGIQAQMIEGGIGDVILLLGVDGSGAALPMSVTSQIEQVASGVIPPSWNYRGGYRWKAGNAPMTFDQNLDSIHGSGWDPNWEDVAGFRGQSVLESPDGQWNQLVVIANNDTFAIYLNGAKINEGFNVVPSEGKIQLEVEFAEFFVRRWELWPLGAAVGPIITLEQLPAGSVGTPYSHLVRAAGGTALTWSVVAGSLPPGLSINSSSGQIAGTPTANGAFSFSVQVADTGGGLAMQSFEVAVSPGAPVTGGLVLHLDAAQGVSASGNTVTAWADLSGNGNHLVAIGDPRVGTIQTPTGLQAIRLDGVDDALERTSGLTGLPSGNANRTMFLVARYNTSTWWSGVAYGTAAENQSFGLYVKHPTGELVLHGNSGSNDLVSTVPGIGAGWLVHSGLVSNGTATHFKDGTQIGQFAHTYDTGLTKLVIGAEIGNAGHVGMEVAAVLIYDRALSTGEQADVEAYLQTRYLTGTPPPVITVPANVIAEATGSSGAVVNFTTSAVDSSNASVPTTNTPASGAVFPLGTSTVTVTAVDALGRSATSTFTVTVRDTTPPAITVPADLTAGAPDNGGTAVGFATSATDLVDGVVTTTNTPASGSVFPIGTTTVTTTAVDAAGNSAARTFAVAVSVGAPITPQTVIPLISGNAANLLYTWSPSQGIGAVTDRFTVQDGVLHVIGAEDGAIISTDRYRDYVLVLEYKWGARQWGGAAGHAKNSGLLLHSRGYEGGHDNRNMPGLEVQLAEGSVGDILLEMGNDEFEQLLPMSMSGRVSHVEEINPTWNYRGGNRWDSNGTVAFFAQIYETIHWSGWDPHWDDVPGYRGQIDHESPDGQWNQIVIKVQGGYVSVHLNGTKVNELLDCFPSEGKVQIENEGSEYFVRRWELRPLGSPVGPSIRKETLASGFRGAPYLDEISAWAGNGSLHWSISAGNLPPGLTLDPQNGTLSGTPLLAGVHAFTVTVTDDFGLAASQPYQISIGHSVPVTSGLVFHLDSTQGVSTFGSSVLAWADLSGNENDVVAVNDPQHGTVTTPLGFPAVRLDGVDDFLERTDTLTGFPSGNSDRTMFLVARYNNSTWWAGAAYGTVAANESFGLCVKHPNGELVLHGNSSGNDLVSTTPGIGAGWMVQSGLINGGMATHFKDGVQIGQFAHSYNTGLTKLVIGAEIGGMGFAGMDVAALLIYDRALSPGERAEVDAYLQNRFLADTMPPEITVPPNLTVEASSSSGAMVSFTTSAMDPISGTIPTTNLPASGAVFPLGTTTVTVSATDLAGNLGTATFTVTVRDTAGPTAGTMTLTPAPRAHAGEPLTVSFPGWTDPLAPLSYTVLVDNVVMQAGSTTANITFTGPTIPGAHSLKGCIFDSLGNVTEVTQSFTVNTPIESWRQTFYGTPANLGNAADQVDPYQTGVPNLVAFAFLGPNQNPGQARLAQLPQAQMSGGNLFFSFTQPAGVDGIIYGAEWSTTLMNDWQSIIDSGSGDHHLFSVPVVSDAQMFLRLKVTSP